MDAEPQDLITLDFLREDGRHEITKLVYYSLIQARNMADAVFRRNNIRYIEVEIRTRSGYRETLSNMYPATVDDLQHI